MLRLIYNQEAPERFKLLLLLISSLDKPGNSCRYLRFIKVLSIHLIYPLNVSRKILLQKNLTKS